MIYRNVLKVLVFYSCLIQNIFFEAKFAYGFFFKHYLTSFHLFFKSRLEKFSESFILLPFLYGSVPMARKASLARFLEKRKERYVGKLQPLLTFWRKGGRGGCGVVWVYDLMICFCFIWRESFKKLL